MFRCLYYYLLSDVYSDVKVTPYMHLLSRLSRVRKRIAAADLDALLISYLPNVRYLSGFDGSSANLIVTKDQLYFITDFRYITAVESLFANMSDLDFTLVTVDLSYDETIGDTLLGLGVQRIGVEGAHFTIRQYSWLRDFLGAVSKKTNSVCLVPTERIIESVRLCKDSYEIELIRTAAAKLSEVALEVLPKVSLGRSERDVAAEVDWTIHRMGFERTAFETIVASGPNSALPHARPSERVLSPGDLVVLDFGGVHDGYCVDMTRTVCLGIPDTRAEKIYEAVLEAQAAAISAIAVGVSVCDIDEAARDSLKRHGFADAFGHGTGHGLGLEVHEEPRISRRRPQKKFSHLVETLIEVGMVFTIEPGVYISDFGGVRIEDDLLVTPNGHEVLTQVPYEFVSA